MKMRLKCEEPKQVVYTVTCTATAAEWEHFRERLDDVVMKMTSPGDLVYAFRRQVDDLLAQARKVYWTTDSEHEGDAK